MQTKLTTMLMLQDQMNTKVNSDWRGKNFAWYRAIWIESAEMLDHYGWKWWKKQSPDREQVVLELIDIWHFGLSILLLEKMSAEDIETKLSCALNQASKTNFAEVLESFVAQTLSSRAFDIAGFAALMQCMNLGFDELFRGYVGKNVLNFFRQDHGYQDGSYRKLWAGREDNEHLVEVAESLDSNAEDYQTQLYQALKARYLATESD